MSAEITFSQAKAAATTGSPVTARLPSGGTMRLVRVDTCFGSKVGKVYKGGRGFVFLHEHTKFYEGDAKP